MAVLALLAGCGGDDGDRAQERTRWPAPAPVPRFAIGIDEKNPHLLAPGPKPAAFARFRDALAALEPSHVRILIDWSVIQPDETAPPDLAQPRDGCIRGGAPPCAPYAGFRDTLRAVAALGARPVVLIYGTPEWAARPKEGCEEPGVTPYARPPRPGPYRALLRAILALADAEGIAIERLSPWNEPNHPHFFNPQRAGCEREDRALSPIRYAELARIAAEEVGLDRLLIGETAGLLSHTHAVGAGEFAAALPDDLVCGAAGYAQHAYVSAPRGEARVLERVPPAQNERVLDEVIAGLDAHGCDEPVGVWITETGAGDRPGACADMAAQLRAWRADPRVRGAFQYTLRDDPIFPTGLADPGLTRLYPAYEAWRTRGRSC